MPMAHYYGIGFINHLHYSSPYFLRLRDGRWPAEACRPHLLGQACQLSPLLLLFLSLAPHQLARPRHAPRVRDCRRAHLCALSDNSAITISSNVEFPARWHGIGVALTCLSVRSSSPAALRSFRLPASRPSLLPPSHTLPTDVGDRCPTTTVPCIALRPSNSNPHSPLCRHARPSAMHRAATQQTTVRPWRMSQACEGGLSIATEASQASQSHLPPP